METSAVSAKGRVVVPSRLRRRYGIRNGTRIRFLEEGGEIRMMPVTPELIRANAGFLGTKGKLLRALMEEKNRERRL